MPRDAFGNEINDDPLAGLSSYGSNSGVNQSPSPSPPGIPGGPKRRGAGTLVAIIAVLIV
ncbi:MAG: hypothetical protein JHC95_11750, partial [Solirubrobacteraceae bacterium]|nr:hypothetical protein [Solirubrobacteraceae bacterium]